MSYRPILPGVSQRDGRLRASRIPTVLAGMITSTNSSQGIPSFTSTWTTDFCRGMRILAGKPWLVGSLIGIPQSQPLRRMEGVPTGALPLADTQEHARRDHRQVCQLSRCCHAGMRRPIIRPARLIHRLLCGTVPMVRLDESDGGSGLDPFCPSLRYKPLGAIRRSESTPGHRVLDSDVFAHSSRVMPRWGLRVCPQRKAARHRAGESLTRVPSLGASSFCRTANSQTSPAISFRNRCVVNALKAI